MGDKVNRGKDFESVVKKSLESIEGCSVDRLHDQTSGFAGSSNICDFIVYKKPVLWYIECKCCYGNTLSIHSNSPKKKYGAISNNQWEGLLDKSKIEGVTAGIIVWFIEHDRTIFIPIQELECKRNKGYCSVNIKELDTWSHAKLYGQKKRVFFDYDMKSFLDWGRVI